ncbi:MAG: C-terminal target protein [Pedosphaera sp.]|nr:C-terminal target protein [Pedosphaera sp.]
MILVCPWIANAATLTGSFTALPAGTNINLTDLGPVDWIHWGQFTEFAYDRKVVTVGAIGDFTILGNPIPADGPFQRSDLSGGYSWRDGLQNSFVTNTTTGTYLIGRNNGFSITVPASPVTNILRVYIASLAGGGNFTATLSDGSAGPYSSTTANVVEGCYTITNAAGSSGNTLTVTWVGSGNSSMIVLQSAALSHLTSNNPPTATLTSPTLNANLSASSTPTLQALASDSDGTVSLVEFFAETNKLGQSTSSPFVINWTNPPPGLHLLTVKATDNLGATYTSKAVEVFVYTNGGSLAGSSMVPPQSVTLSDEGTNDWAHWGLNSATSFDHKADVIPQIGNFTTIGTNTGLTYGDNFTAYNWANGTPTVAAPGTTTGVYIYGLTNGFDLILPASPQPQTVKVYVGLYGARANFRAYLSDASAPEFSDTTLNNFYSNSYRVYTLNYAAAANNQTLAIRHMALNSYDTTFGNVTLQAATLSDGLLPLSSIILITNSASTPTSFGFSFATDPGPTYQVQYADSLPATSWLLLTNSVGDGSICTIIDTNNTATNRFYRIYRP